MAINAEFKLFYEKLYTSEASDPTEVDDFSAGLTLPILGDSDRNAMEKDITLSEINIAIKKIKSSKAPGPDVFAAKLTPLLFKVFEEILERKILPTTMTQATVSCESYRPISLLNCDCKILAKTSRTTSFLPKLVHIDQTGFVV
uniref:Reverse transcriptase domain-containing protein n=1 Tax=Oryzias melastigma TaxID=30732 RepID=A0A3B3DIU4_ORYME